MRPRTAKNQIGVLETPIGALRLGWYEQELLAVELPPTRPDMAARVRPIPEWLAAPLSAYFQDSRLDLGLFVRPEGTVFQQRVWQALRCIPSGMVRTYGELARELHSSARAIGHACRLNPCPLVVPCHRVVARQGLGGFGGQTQGARLAIKAWLLRHEGVHLERLDG